MDLRLPELGALFAAKADGGAPSASEPARRGSAPAPDVLHDPDSARILA